jgi:hypothetical protein
MRRVLNRGVNVFLFEKRVVRQNLVEARTVGQKLKNVGDSNSQSANTWPASTLAFLDSDSLQSLAIHIKV